MLLKDKVAVVTGGARDIGRAISLRFASEGAKVIINFNQSEDKAKETLEMISEIGGEATLVRGDLTKSKDVSNLYEQTLETYGIPDIVMNNTGGIVARKNLVEITENFYRDVFDLNFLSTLLVLKAFLPHMKAGGAVVNMSSQAARDGGGGGSSLYAASKAAISSLTKSMAKEFGPKGIRVNAVCPGMIDTLFHDMFTPDEIRKKVADTTPLRKEGRAEDVADLVCFLASDQASHLTGVNYDINGGFLFS
ncbi:MAG: SDR family NAD(P)-dependent oxidoreductase [Bacteroidota bacterium]